jgi:hypothetical protein
MPFGILSWDSSEQRHFGLADQLCVSCVLINYHTNSAERFIYGFYPQLECILITISEYRIDHSRDIKNRYQEFPFRLPKSTLDRYMAKPVLCTRMLALVVSWRICLLHFESWYHVTVISMIRRRFILPPASNSDLLEELKNGTSCGSYISVLRLALVTTTSICPCWKQVVR